MLEVSKACHMITEQTLDSTFGLPVDLCPLAQVLGEKPVLPEAHTDDAMMDASHRKEAKLYKARQW